MPVGNSETTLGWYYSLAQWVVSFLVFVFFSVLQTFVES
jgi:hypothetical protein